MSMNDDSANIDLRKAHFSLDSLGGRLFEGYTDGRLWNGWACPYFTRGQAAQIVAAWRRCGWDAHFDLNRDAFVISLNQDVVSGKTSTHEMYSAVHIEGLTFYAIGAFSWTWEEGNPDSLPE